MLLSKLRFVLLSCAALTACATVTEHTDNAGKSLVLSQQVATGYRKFRTDPAAGLFTITEDGQGYTTTLCTQQGGCPTSRLAPALSECTARTQSRCKLLGSGRDLLWIYRAALKPEEAAATLCFGALVQDRSLLQYMMAIEKGMPDASASHCAESFVALQRGSTQFGHGTAGGLTGTTGYYRTEAAKGNWQHITGELDVLGFVSRVDGWVKSEQGQITLFRSTATGEIGPALGPILFPPPGTI